MKTWVHELLGNDYVILDTETTGLGVRDEVIQVAVLDKSQQILFYSLICPAKAKVDRKAEAVHGFGDDLVGKYPSLSEFRSALSWALRGRKTVIYNADFDRRLLLQSALANDDAELERLFEDLDCVDLMEPYAEHWGDWSRYHGSYTWQSLANACIQQGVKVAGAHDALGDCRMVQELLHKLAE